MENATTLPERLKKIMDEKSLEAPDLASRLGVDVSTVYRWLEGETKPYKKNLRLIADAYGYEFEWVYSGKGSGSVEEHPISPNAILVVRDPVTDEIWFSIELLARMRVHKVKDLLGGKGEASIKLDMGSG